MKNKKIIKISTVFTWGINTFMLFSFPQSGFASTENYINWQQSNSFSSQHNSTIIDSTLDKINFSEADIKLDNDLVKKEIHIAQRARLGKASWYGPKFHGRRTANGEIFNSSALTAAHRNLPFGTKVKVTNVRNGRSVIVRINDRGPFIKGRIIDVSAGAARKLNMIGSGVATVQLEILGR